MQKAKDAGLGKKSIALQKAQEEIDKLEEEDELNDRIKEKVMKMKRGLNNDGTNKYTEANRLFHRSKFNVMKQYTDRYVRRLKAAHRKLVEKFALGSKYALIMQEKAIMGRARQLVITSHD